MAGDGSDESDEEGSLNGIEEDSQDGTSGDDQAGSSSQSQLPSTILDATPPIVNVRKVHDEIDMISTSINSFIYNLNRIPAPTPNQQSRPSSSSYYNDRTILQRNSNGINNGAPYAHSTNLSQSFIPQNNEQYSSNRFFYSKNQMVSASKPPSFHNQQSQIPRTPAQIRSESNQRPDQIILQPRVLNSAHLQISPEGRKLQEAQSRFNYYGSYRFRQNQQEIRTRPSSPGAVSTKSNVCASYLIGRQQERNGGIVNNSAYYQRGGIASGANSQPIPEGRFANDVVGINSAVDSVLNQDALAQIIQSSNNQLDRSQNYNNNNQRGSLTSSQNLNEILYKKRPKRSKFPVIFVFSLRKHS